MRKNKLLACFLLAGILGGTTAETARANDLFGGKVKKIVVQPTEAKIYVDGNYVGDGTYEARFTSKDDFLFVKLEAPGYVSKEVKIFKTDSRNVISFNLKVDDSEEGSVGSELANRYFTINVREGVDGDMAWKLLSQVLLNYFNEFRTSDKSSGYMTTTWEYREFPQSGVKVRTSVQLKEITNEGLAYQIRICSEIAPIKARSTESYKPWPRVVKKYEPLINEMQQRIGKN